jgi:hypothetical protein
MGMRRAGDVQSVRMTFFAIFKKRKRNSVLWQVFSIYVCSTNKKENEEWISKFIKVRPSQWAVFDWRYLCRLRPLLLNSTSAYEESKLHWKNGTSHIDYKVVWKIGKFDLAEKYYRRLINEVPSNIDVTAIFIGKIIERKSVAWGTNLILLD